MAIDVYTKSLLHFTGSDASTTFTDESGKIWTGGGTAQLDTSQFKFGSSSLLLDGNSDYISTPNNDDFNVGSGDFTIDFLVRFNNVPGNGQYAALYSHRISGVTNNNMTLWYAGTEKWYFSYSTSGSSQINIYDFSTHTPSTNVWYHIAYVRNGNNIDIFIEGQKQETKTISGAFFNSTAAPIIGASNSPAPTYFVDGWIDEFRFSKGIARWTTNFTPQSCQYLTGHYLHARRDRMNMQPVSTQNAA